jgi:iron complex transport system ATP-binding protein
LSGSDQSTLSIESLGYSVSGITILDSISIGIRRGEIVMIIGPNGAGKTTLLKCLIRILKPSEGSVHLDGKPIEEMGQKEIARRVGYVPQADARYLPFTVDEFVMMGRYPHLSPFTTFRERDRTAVRQALVSTGTSHLSGRRMLTLSGGEKQMVMIAAAVAQGADILLLDEPAAFLDPGRQHDIMRMLSDLNQAGGVTMLMVTHDVNCALMMGDRVVVLSSGSVVYDDNPRKLAGSGILEEVYDQKFEFIPHPRTGNDMIIPDVIADGG